MSSITCILLPLLISLMLMNGVKSKVYCPGGTSYCQDGSTCCMMPNHQYVCCPLPNATCCQDGYHCCARGYNCISLRCVKSGTKRDASDDFIEAVTTYPSTTQ